ncbi:MAG: WD40 repeat domain-containing protein [Planctomycetaceae bacterium]
MRTMCLTFTVVVACSSTLEAAKRPAVAPPPSLAKNGAAAVVARKPDSPGPAQLPKSPAAVFAERDVARLKALAGKDKKLAPKLAKAEARLKRLLSDTSRGKAEPKNMTLLETFKHNRPVISCRFDTTGDFIFAGAMDKDLHRWNILSGKRVEFSGHASWIRRMDVRGSAQPLVVTGSYAGRLIWWNADDPSAKPLRSVDAHRGYVRGVAISPDGKLVASGGNDNMVRVWSADDGRLIKELPGHTRHVYNVKFDPSGRFLVSGDLMGVLKQWEVGSWKHVRDLDAKVLSKYDKTFRADCGGIRGMDFSPNGRYLVVCGIGSVTNAFAGVGKPTAVLFDFATGKRLKVMLPAKNYKGTCWNVKWHPSGAWFVGVGGGGGMAWFWKPDSAKSFHAVKLPGCGYDVSFHPDGLRMAVATYNRVVAVYDLGPKGAAKPRAAKKRKRRRK